LPKSSDLLNHLFANIREQKLRKTRNTGLQAKKDALLAFMRAHQRGVEADLSPLVAVLSARQQGKSTGALLLAALRCLQKPGAQWVIIGLTRGSVQRIYWDALRSLDEAFELGLKFQEQRLVVRFPSGSAIHFFGADKLDEIEKLRGSRFHGAIVDECKSYPQTTLKLLIEDILGACLKGQAGQLYLIGTPGDVLAGEFYLATCAQPVLLEKRKRWSNLPAGEPTREAVINDVAMQLKGVWSFHLWGPQTNDVTFVNERTGVAFTMWEAFLSEKELRGWADDHPTWRREYLGQWVPGDGRLVYRYRSHLHDYDEEPGKRWGLPIDEAGWRTVLGIDFGTKDGTAFVIWAWHPNQPHLWELYSEKRKPEDWGVADLRMSVKLIAGWYKDLEGEYGPFDVAVGDPAGLATMVMDTLAAEHEVYVEPAEKKEKLDHIELFNDDLDSGRIHIRRGGELAEELLGNKWLEKTLGTERRKEDPATANDLCDAALYAFRWCLHRQARPKPPTGPVALTPDWFRQMAAQEREATLAKLSRAREYGERLDTEWWDN
jgi:hypothetical protein